MRGSLPSTEELLETLGIGSWSFDLDTGEVRWSALLQTALGFDPQRAQAGAFDALLERIHPDDRERLAQAVLQIGEMDGPITLELRALDQSLAWRWYETRGRVVRRDDEGRANLVLGTMQSIDERKRADQIADIRRRFVRVVADGPTRETLIRAITEAAASMPDAAYAGLFLRNARGTWAAVHQVSADDATRELFQSFAADSEIARAMDLRAPTRVPERPEPDAPADRPSSALLFPIDLGANRHACLGVARRGARPLAPTTVDALAALAAEGGAALIALDAREEVARKERNLAGFFAALDDYVVVVDRQGVVRHLNPKGAALGTVSVGGSLLDVHPERVRDEAMPAFAEMLAGTRTSCSFPLRTLDGGEIPVDTRLVPGEWDDEPVIFGIARDVGERNRERERLEHSEALLRATLDSTADGVLVVDGNGKIASHNLRFQEMWRIPEELIARGGDDALLAFVMDQLCDPASFVSEVQRLYGSDEASFDTLQFRDGRVFERYSRTFDAVGMHARLWSFRDVTARARTEAALRATVDAFNALVERVPVGVYKLRMKADGGVQFEYVSPRWEQLVGIPAAAVYADSSLAFRSVHPEDQEAFFALNEAARRSPRVYQWKGRILVHGKPRWFELTSSPTVEANGDIVWDGVQADCTEREEAAARLRQSEERLRLTLENAPHVAVHWFGLDGRIVYWNQASTRLYGWTSAEVLGELTDTIFGPSRSAAVAREAAAALQRSGDHMGPTRFELRTKSGELRIVEATLFLIPGEAGAPYLAAVEVDVTRQEDALRSRERERAFLKALVQAIPDPVWLKDPEGVYLACNPRFEDLYAAAETSIVGRTDADFVGPELARFFRENDQLAVEAGGPRRNEERLRFARDGHEGVFETTKTPMYGEKGELIGVLGIAHDITEARAAAQALREGEARLSAIFQQAADGIVLIDVETLRFVEFNDAACASLGYTREEFQQLSLVDISAEMDSAALLHRIQADLGGDGAAFETTHRRKDGELRTVRVSGRPVLTDGRVRIAAISVDITERRRAESELQSALIFLRESQAIAHVGGWKASLAGRRLHWTEEIWHLLEAPPRRWIAIEEAIRYFRPEDAPGMVEALTDAARSGASFRRELRMVSASDREFWAEIRCIGQVEDPVEGTCLTGTFQDITDRKRGELELEGHRRHLEELVAARTAEAVAARDAAEAANRTKTAFLANMSHEIRTPMNAILGLTHLLRGSITNPRQRDQVEKVHTAAQHLLGLLNDILDLSKIEAGKVDLVETAVDLESILGDVLNLVGERAASKGLELIARLDPRLPRGLRGDATKLRQVVLNFVSNAVKFTERGSVTIVAAPAGDAPGRLRIEVHDTGPGVEPAQLRRLFQPFEQVDASTTRKHGGTGLGLAISRRLVERMGGETGVTTEPGAGSCFWCEIPLRIEPAAEEARPKLLAGRHAVLLHPVGPARDALVEQLHVLGATVSVGDNPVAALAEALDRAGGSRPPLNLIDLQLLGGIADARIAAQLRALPCCVGIAAPGRRPAPVELAQLGIVALVERPVLPRSLEAAVAAVCERGGRNPTSPPPVGPQGRTIRRARVLLAEDDPVNREAATAFLASVGLEIDTVEDGLQAVERVRTDAYDLVLMDVQMPRMDGLEATRAIRALPGRAGLPIVAMTADAFEEDRRRCIEVGMVDHVSKPVDPEVLLEKLARWLPPSAEDEDEVLRPVDVGPLADIAGLDVERGLSSVQGHPEGWIRLLEMFGRLHAEDVARIQEAVARQDREEAGRVAHSLKGVAGTLGMPELAVRAAAVEAAFRRGESPDALLPPLDRELTRLVQALQAALRPADERHRGGVDDPEARGCVENLLRAAEADDVRTVTLLRENADRIETVVGAGRMRQIRRAVEGFDFPTAAVALRAALG